MRNQPARSAILPVLALLVAASGAALANDARKARDFTYADINPRSATHGKTIALSDVYAREGVVLNFIASWCPPCWRELPTLQKLDRESSTPVVFVAADEHGPADDLLARAEQLGIDQPILLVPADDIARMEEFWDHAMLPSTYLIDFQGNIRQVFEGLVSEDALFASASRHFPQSGVTAPAEGGVRTGAVHQ